MGKKSRDLLIVETDTIELDFIVVNGKLCKIISIDNKKISLILILRLGIKYGNLHCSLHSIAIVIIHI